MDRQRSAAHRRHAATGGVTKNTFLNCGHRGIYLFNLTETKIEDNYFNCAQPISGSFHTTSRNVSVSYNTVLGSKRHGIELQNYGDTESLLVEGNYVGGWQDGRPQWSSHMALSIAMGGNAHNTMIRNNVLVADGVIPQKISQGVPIHYFTAIEAMGKGYIIENNHAEGWGWYQLVGNGDANWVTRNNTWLGTDRIPVRRGSGPHDGQEIVPEHGFTGGPAQNTGNFYGKVGDKTRPAAGVRNGQPNPNPNPNPNPQPQPDPGPAPGLLAASNLGGKGLSTSAIALSWKDNSTSESGYRIRRKTTRGGDAWVAIRRYPPAADRCVDHGLDANWEYDYRMIALGANATESASRPCTRCGRRRRPAEQPVSANRRRQAGPQAACPHLEGYALSHDQIRMIWKDTNRNETGYRVEQDDARRRRGWTDGRRAARPARRSSSTSGSRATGSTTTASSR